MRKNEKHFSIFKTSKFKVNNNMYNIRDIKWPPILSLTHRFWTSRYYQEVKIDITVSCMNYSISILLLVLCMHNWKEESICTFQTCELNLESVWSLTNIKPTFKLLKLCSIINITHWYILENYKKFSYFSLIFILQRFTVYLGPNQVSWYHRFITE